MEGAQAIRFCCATQCVRLWGWCGARGLANAFQHLCSLTTHLNWLAVWAGVGTAKTADLPAGFQKVSLSRAEACFAAAASPSSTVGAAPPLRRSQPLPGRSAKKASPASAAAGRTRQAQIEQLSDSCCATLHSEHHQLHCLHSCAPTPAAVPPAIAPTGVDEGEGEGASAAATPAPAAGEVSASAGSEARHPTAVATSSCCGAATGLQSSD